MVANPVWRMCMRKTRGATRLVSSSANLLSPFSMRAMHSGPSFSGNAPSSPKGRDLPSSPRGKSSPKSPRGAPSKKSFSTIFESPPPEKQDFEDLLKSMRKSEGGLTGQKKNYQDILAQMRMGKMQ